MNDATTKAILDRVDALAAHLNTTAGQLFDVLKHQAFIEGIQDIIAGAFFLAVTVTLIVWGLHLRTSELAARVNGPVRGLYGEEQTKAWGFMFLLAFAVAVIGLSVCNSMLTEFLNPQYWAIQKLAELLKK